MKLLWLGNSNDTGNYLPVEQRPPHLAAERLQEILGLDIDIELRTLWPSERAPSLVEQWVGEFEPDLVFLQVIDHSFCYESVPLKVQRKLPIVGKSVAGAGEKAAQTEWLAFNPIYRALRDLAKNIIGGEPLFTPEEVLGRVSAAIRVVLRDEDRAALVRGPHGPNDTFGSDRRRARGEARRQVVHQGLRDLCAELHITYQGRDTPEYRDGVAERVGDNFHFGASANILYVEDIVDGLVRAWVQQHPEYELALTRA